MKVILLLLAIMSAALPAHAWSPSEMDRQIASTNFKVGAGCSGTLISVERQLILTNHHCVLGEVKIIEEDEVAEDGTVRRIRRQVRMPTTASQDILDESGRVIGRMETQVEIIAVDTSADLALLRALHPLRSTIAAPILPQDGHVTRGERVYIVGNPALLEGSVVEGIISNVRRQIGGPFANQRGEPWEGMQISGGIWGGNSGGAVYNDRGQLIGVPAAGHRQATFIGFAVPIDVIHAFLKRACQADLYGGKNPSTCP